MSHTEHHDSLKKILFQIARRIFEFAVVAAFFFLLGHKIGGGY